MKISNLIWPSYCLGCRKDTNTYSACFNYLCPDCLNKIQITNTKQCPLCKSAVSENYLLCENCQKKTGLEGIISAACYKNPLVKETIRKFKYKGITSLSYPLSLLITKSLRNFLKVRQTTFFSFYLDWCVIPVPLTKTRRKRRGFNQAEILGRRINEIFEIPLKTDIIEKIARTSPQSRSSSRKERLKNVQGSIALTPQADLRTIRGRKILIIDDVATSGATLTECARELKDYSSEIWGLTIAA